MNSNQINQTVSCETHTTNALRKVWDEYCTTLASHERSSVNAKEEAVLFRDLVTAKLANVDPSRLNIHSIGNTFLQGAIFNLSFRAKAGHLIIDCMFDKQTGVISLECALGYKGMLHLINLSDNIIHTSYDLVHVNDTFRFNGNNQPVTHSYGIGERGELAYGYASTYLTNNMVITDVMDASEINAIGANNGGYAWKGAHRSEMEKKTVFRRHFKSLASVLKLPMNQLRIAHD